MRRPERLHRASTEKNESAQGDHAARALAVAEAVGERAPLSGGLYRLTVEQYRELPLRIILRQPRRRSAARGVALECDGAVAAVVAYAVALTARRAGLDRPEVPEFVPYRIR